jgi:MHS family proline/betaine transporter-like MFS transporter
MVRLRRLRLFRQHHVGVTVFGGFAPLTVTWLIGATGSKLVPAFYIIAAAVLSMVVVGLTFRRAP